MAKARLAMTRFLGWSAMTVAAVAVAGCATMNVSSHVERDLDFTQYHTYGWGPTDALPTRDPRLDGDPFFHDHMQGAVDKSLQSRGLTLSTSGPDLLLHYHANVTERLQANRLDQLDGFCTSESCPGGITEYEASTIVLDVVDARTNRVIWRGWAQADLKGLIEDHDKMANQIDHAVTRLLRRLPPTL
jgi:hypothetical protein